MTSSALAFIIAILATSANAQVQVGPAKPASVARPYAAVAIAAFARTEHTHVCITGMVAVIKRERDGDLHVRIEDSEGAFVVAEEIPGLRASGPRPVLNRLATACGISREDRRHGWWEIHPVERWGSAPSGGTR